MPNKALGTHQYDTVGRVALQEPLDLGLVLLVLRLAPGIKESRRVDEVEPIHERMLVERDVLRRGVLWCMMTIGVKKAVQCAELKLGPRSVAYLRMALRRDQPPEEEVDEAALAVARQSQ